MKMSKEENELDELESEQINIELNEKMAQGIYSNLAIVNNSMSEFVLDFVTVMPGTPKAKVNSRVIMSPHHVKRLLMSLGQNVGKYEEMYGEIKDIQEDKEIPVPFFGTAGEA